MPLTAGPVRTGFPTGFVITLVVAVLLYAVMASIVAGSRSSDAAGNGLSVAYGAVFTVALWIALIVLLVLARSRGSMPGGGTAALVVLVPLALIGCFIAIGRFGEGEGWALAVVFALPALLATYAIWARFGTPAGAGFALLGVGVLLSIAPFSAGFLTAPSDARHNAERALAERTQQAAIAKESRAAREREAADFSALGADSSIADYLPYLHSGTYGDRALAGIQKARSRQADAMALLGKLPLGELAELSQFNVVPTRELCAAYGNALSALANRIAEARGDHLAAAIDLEWQMPNLKWLITAKCDLSAPLGRAEVNIRAVADSPRLTNLADTLAEIRKVKP
jgi:hypothetical protein